MTAHAPIRADDRGLDSFHGFLEALDALAGPRRQAEMIAFARSRSFHACGMTLEGRHGAVHREAWASLRDEINADTPARMWDSALNDPERVVICRHLKIDPTEKAAFFATFPFRIIRTAEDRPWIAGAIGCQRLLDPKSYSTWRHIDIEEVILWNPRTGEVRVAGDTGARLVTGCDVGEPRLTIYGEGFAFFRAWADRRAEFKAAHVAALAEKRILPVEAPDNLMPGALVIGDLDHIHWRDLGATVLVAGPGVDAQKLNRAIYRSARLPRVEAA